MGYIQAALSLSLFGVFGLMLWPPVVSASGNLDTAEALVCAVCVLGYVFVALSLIAANPNLAEQINDAERRLRDQLASLETWKKPIAALTASQQTAVENVQEANEMIRVLVEQLKRMSDEQRGAIAPVMAERDKAVTSERRAVAELYNAYCTIWRLKMDDDSNDLIQQVALEFERVRFPRVGIEPIMATGVPVDDRLHNVAAPDEQSKDIPSGSVFRVIRPGYQWNGVVEERAEVVRASALNRPLPHQSSVATQHPAPEIAEDSRNEGTARP